MPQLPARAAASTAGSVAGAGGEDVDVMGDSARTFTARYAPSRFGVVQVRPEQIPDLLGAECSQPSMQRAETR